MSDGIVKYEAYVDESRQSGDRYMCFGGILIRAKNVDLVCEEIKAYKAANNIHAELKWVKVSRAYLEKYRGLVDLIFDLIKRKLVHYKVMSIDMTKVNHRDYNDGDGDLGYYKFVRQFVASKFCVQYYKPKYDQRFMLYLDNRNTRHSLDTLHEHLNKTVNHKLSRQVSPFTAVKHIDSKKSELIQVLDILLGASGYCLNGRHLLEDSAPHKVLLTKYIAHKAGVKCLSDETPRGRLDYEVWKFKLGKKK